MFILNDKDGKWVNGTLGVVESVPSDFGPPIVVVLKDRPTVKIEVEPETWWFDKEYSPIEPEDSEKFDTYKQYPIMLAWAVTIHKAQGLTLDSVGIDLGKVKDKGDKEQERAISEKGLLYVALSRCRSLAGIKLENKIKDSDIKASEEACEYYCKLRAYQSQRSARFKPYCPPSAKAHRVKDSPINLRRSVNVQAAKARRRFSEIIERAGCGRERIVLTRRGKPRAVLVSIEDLKLLEDRVDSDNE